MQAPRLPSMFKIQKNKQFTFSTRYYDERKERLSKLKEGKSVEIKFKSDRNSGMNKGRTGRTFRLVTVLFILLIFAYLILK